MAFDFEKSEQKFHRIILVIVAILTISETAFSRVTSRKLISQDLRSFSYTESVGWPMGVNQFGQVTAIDINDKNNILIFHRGNHVWNERYINNILIRGVRGVYISRFIFLPKFIR